MTTITVSSGQTSSGLTLGAYDTATILTAGSAVSTYLASGAVLTVSSGGTAVDTTIDPSGGTIDVQGGTLSLTTFAGSGLLDMTAGGYATATALGSGAVMILGVGAAGYGTQIGAYSIVSNQEGLLVDTRVESGGIQLDSFGGYSSGSTVMAGGEQYDDLSAITAGTVVSSGGFQLVVDGSVASMTDVRSGGTLLVFNGGVAIHTTVESGGHVQSGGVVELSFRSIVSAFTGSSSAQQIVGLSAFVLSGGALISSVVSAGSIQIESGGKLAAAKIFGEASVSVGYGGSVQGTEVAWDFAASGGASEAGLLTVSSGGTALNTTLDAPNPYNEPLNQAELEAASGAIVSQTLVEKDSVLLLDSGAQATSTGIMIGGMIDLTGTPYDPNGTANLSSPSNVLTITEAGQQTNLSLSGNYSNEFFKLGPDGVGGTLVTATGTPCFHRGTRVTTIEGETPVELLRIGDQVQTLSGQLLPIIWIGRRSYCSDVAISDSEIAPIRFRAGCLAAGIPRSDLLVSPLHAIYIDGVLIPAAALVNGASILQNTTLKSVGYFHVELPSHEIIFAEGVPSESYLDDENRKMFDNAGDHPSFSSRPRGPASTYCAARLEGGDRVEEIRRRLAARCATVVPSSFVGLVEQANRANIRGWAADVSHPWERQLLRISMNGIVIGQTLANLERSDPELAKLTEGRCGFSFDIPGGLPYGRRRQVIEVQRASDGLALHGSPFVLDVGVNQEAASPVQSPRGRLDSADRHVIRGWANDRNFPEERISVQITDNGELLDTVVANFWRPDIVAAGLGSGWCGFEVSVPGGLSPLVRHVVCARFALDGQPLPGSPMLIEGAASFDNDLRSAVRSSVAALNEHDARLSVYAFLCREAEAVLQQIAKADADQSTRLAVPSPRRKKVSQPAPAQLRALVIDPRYPDPSRDAGSIALLSHIRGLQRLGFVVSFAATDEMHQGNDRLSGANVSCCTLPTYRTAEEVLRRQQGSFDVVYLHRAEVCMTYLLLARKMNPCAKIVYSVADLHCLRLQRQFHIQGSPAVEYQAEHDLAMEIACAKLADVVLTHSEFEAAWLRKVAPQAVVRVVPWDVPPAQVAVPFERRHGIAFVGNFGHEPNIDAAFHLIQDVMKLVWPEIPGVECLIVGADPPPKLTALASSRVRFLGSVNDLASVWARVRVSVAPVRFGAGVKGKVLASLSAGIPCVMSPVAAEGLQIPGSLRKLIGQEAADLAYETLKLHKNKRANYLAAEAGLRFVRRNHSEEVVTRALDDATRSVRRDHSAALAQA